MSLFPWNMTYTLSLRDLPPIGESTEPVDTESTEPSDDLVENVDPNVLVTLLLKAVMIIQ